MSDEEMQREETALDKGWQSSGSVPKYLEGALLRQSLFLFLTPIVFILIAFYFVLVTTPLYSSSTLLHFDVKSEEANQIDTILSSHAVAIGSVEMTEEVTDALFLADRINTDPGLFEKLQRQARLMFGLGDASPPSEKEIEQIIISRVAENLDVSRVGDTLILKVTYTSASKTEAAEIANAYSSIYLEGLRLDEAKLVERRSRLLRERAAEAIRISTEAYRDAQKLRSEASADFASVAEFDARVAGLKNRLSEVDVELAALRARLALLSPDNELAAIETAALQLDGGTSLYSALSDASRRLDVLQSDPNATDGRAILQLETSIKGLRTAFEDLMRQSRNELNRELLILEARRASTEKNLSELLEQSGTRRWSEFIIADHRADVYRKVHADQLAKLEDLYGKSLEVNARILTAAQPSIQPSWPQSKLVLILAAIAGLFVGLSCAMWREWRRAATTLA